ncbi:MAG: peptidylprolyl isomerase [Clostridia bacterium]|nr:peptidylprolyl isomerase [Clostridia bacterium]
MGKTSRKKQIKEAKENERQERLAAQKKAEQRLNRMAAVISACAVAVLIVITSLYLGINALLDNGYFLRKNVSVSSDNYEINNAMVSYFFYEEYRDFINKNYESLGDMKLSSEKSLKKQKSYYGDGSWYDHFMKLTEENIKTLTAFCEEAEKNDIKLAKADLDEIDYLIEKYKSNAKSGQKTELEYYEYMYGRGVTEKDIRDCLSMELLAEKYKDILMKDFSISDEDYQAEYNKNPQKYNTVSALVYSFKFEESYQNLTNENTSDECISAINSDIIRDYAENYDTELDENLINALITSNMISSYRFGEKDALDKFAFSTDAKKDDFYIEKTDKGCTAYLLKSNPSKEDYATKNIKIIYCANKTYGSEAYAENFINNIYDEINEADNLENRFKTLAVTYSEDLDSKFNYGSYKNLKTGVFEATAEEWVFSEQRKPGDCEIVSGAEGKYIILYEGDGLSAWKASVFDEKYAEYFDKLVGELIEKYNIASNKKNLKKISI